MAIQKIHRFHALKPGAQIWFLPEKNASSWSKMMDWYLNFQICRYSNRTRSHSDSDLKKIIIEEEIHFDFDFSYPKNLMISSEEYLPTKALIILETKNIESQILDIVAYITKLQLESIRIFLPLRLSSTEFVKKWQSQKKSTKDIKISLVEDTST